MNNNKSLINVAGGFLGTVALSIGLATNNSLGSLIGSGVLTTIGVNHIIEETKKQTRASLEKQYNQPIENILPPIEPVTRVFCDGANTIGTLQELGIQADYQALIKEIGCEDAVLKYYYAVSTPVNPGENAFIKYLEKINFEVVKSRKNPLADGNYKIKGDDVQIATDMAIDANPGDQIILISGDGDFEYAVKKLQQKGCQVTVVSTGANLSKALKKAANTVIELNDIKTKIKRQKSQSQPPINSASQEPKTA